MPQNTHLELIRGEAERIPNLNSSSPGLEVLLASATLTASSLVWLPSCSCSDVFAGRCRALVRSLTPLLDSLESPRPKSSVPDDLCWLFDNARMLFAELQSTTGELKRLRKIPHVRTPEGHVIPRVLAIAEAFLEAADYQFSDEALSLFAAAFQQSVTLELRELWTLAPALKLILLERISERGAQLLRTPTDKSLRVGVCVRSLSDIGQTNWKETIEPLILFDHILRQDPAGRYGEMDFDSRDLYRHKLSNIAEHSDCTELEAAQAVLELARLASRQRQEDPRIAERVSHVGYYLLDEGAAALGRRVGFRPPFGQRVQALLRSYPECYLLGIELGTFALALSVLWLLPGPFGSAGLWRLALLGLLLPCSQSTVQFMNHWVTSLLPPEILPKLDFSESVPPDCVTLVAVPCLLLNENQVRGLVEDLEVRFLGNHDPNVYFALLTDLPETSEPACEDSPLVTLCGELIQQLNEKHARQERGQFFLLHRHRVYHPREQKWMGWERKRGKLLDLNRLLCAEYDSFPVKVGNLAVLPLVRFVITLDADTELPRGTAQRMIGAMAHPLNQALIDPDTNIVAAGYGILQPRVGVSVHSTARSRLAAIYAGETGFDIYTRAVSDAYQDLFGEGIFTGKGIYEVAVVHRVLNRRFPRNALLSHDLIEGAYARAGLVSDVEVIEDYPSHYSAYNRRKHRWLRGDWQIAGWLFPEVVEESGERTPNPISMISRWKIFDNLRRSLVEPATFLLLILGWLVLNRPGFWTLATIGILLVPAFSQFALDLLRAGVRRDPIHARSTLTAFATTNVNLFFTVTFLAHQTLLSLDAVLRSLIRRVITHRRLLEWETAAEVEMGARGRAPADMYLGWVPALALGLSLLIAGFRREALPAALPILILWASSRRIATWLNQPPATGRKRTRRKDVLLLRRFALQTWRYFAELSTADHHWLVPDNVQEDPPAVATRVSPTNLGLLLNARQVACEFGYVTVPEFVCDTRRTLATLDRLRKFRGHMLNWYDTQTLQPLAPFFVSTVDSGNLLASLWTLQQGCLDQLRRPIVRRCLLHGLLDHLRALAAVRAFPRRLLSSCERHVETDDGLQFMLGMPESSFADRQGAWPNSKRATNARWLADAAMRRFRSVHHLVRDYAPWRAPEFASLRHDPALNLPVLDTIALEQLPPYLDQFAKRLDAALNTTASQELETLYRRLIARLPSARANLARVTDELRGLAADAGRLADAMDFSFLLNPRRKLLSVGFDVDQRRLHSACYDLLGTESRTAIFAAVAKEDIPQESWFLLGRAHTLTGGRPVLVSWTGTTFEYLMPSLWMRSYPNTLLERSRTAAVRAQQAYARLKGVPWGISESAHARRDENGNYQYHAFGLGHLALRKSEIDSLVISPYSTFLSLNTDPEGALKNLRRMHRLGWFGKYGFCEAADFGSTRRRIWRQRCQVVRCWMAHHQGMSLLALANFLSENVVQRWFHGERRVQATELLLHEKPVSYVRQKDVAYHRSAA